MTRRFILTLLTLAALALACAACANREASEASRQAAEAANAEQDDAQCRENGVAVGTLPYEQCRKSRAEARAANNIAQERRKEAFQPVLGAGTDAQSGH